MKNICLIGNSHVASFKLAWDKVQRKYPDVKITFFAERRDGLTELEVKDGMLMPSTDRLREILEHTSGGLSIIDPRAYDAILLVGFLWAYPKTDGLFSHAAARQALLDSFDDDYPGFDVIRKIRSITNIPIFMAHQPLWKVVGKPVSGVSVEPYRRLVKFINETLVEQYRATLLEQPEETITNGFNTRTEFSVGAMRLDIGNLRSRNAPHLGNERAHMNGRFGEICFAEYIPTILA